MVWITGQNDILEYRLTNKPIESRGEMKYAGFFTIPNVYIFYPIGDGVKLRNKYTNVSRFAVSKTLFNRKQQKREREYPKIVFPMKKANRKYFIEHSHFGWILDMVNKALLEKDRGGLKPIIGNDFLREFKRVILQNGTTFPCFEYTNISNGTDIVKGYEPIDTNIPGFLIRMLDFIYKKTPEVKSILAGKPTDGHLENIFHLYMKNLKEIFDIILDDKTKEELLDFYMTPNRGDTLLKKKKKTTQHLQYIVNNLISFFNTHNLDGAHFLTYDFIMKILTEIFYIDNEALETNADIFVKSMENQILDEMSDMIYKLEVRHPYQVIVYASGYHYVNNQVVASHMQKNIELQRKLNVSDKYYFHIEYLI